MTTINIPQKLLKEKSLVLIPKDEYEELMEIKKTIRTVAPSKSEKAAIIKGRKEIMAGKFESWEEIQNEMASTLN